MKRLLLILLALLMLTGCDTFLPREKHPVRKCGEPRPIYDDADSTHVLAWARVCVTVWEVPTPYGDSVAVDEPVTTDTTYTRVP